MKRKDLISITICSIICTTILYAFYLISPLSNPIYKGDFSRHYINPNVKRVADLDLTEISYFAGMDYESIYLARFEKPFELLKIDRKSFDIKYIQLSIENIDFTKIDDLRARLFKIHIDSPYFYISDGSIPAIYRGTIENGLARRFMPDSAYFADILKIGGSSFALKSYSIKEKGYELAKESNTAPYFSFNYDLLEKKVDGLFCVDGVMHFNSILDQVIYVYNYRSEFIVADTNLNLVLRGHTLDTFKTPVIKVVSYTSDENIQTKAIATSTTRVNGASTATNKYLFIQSNLIAQNEDEDVFKYKYILDIYNTITGSYEHSFYIDKIQHKNLTEIIYEKELLFALYESDLVLYRIDSRFFR